MSNQDQLARACEANGITTYHLRNDVLVFARIDERFPNGYPVTYANRSQAERRAAQLRAAGVNASVYKSPHYRPFYVSILPGAPS